MENPNEAVYNGTARKTLFFSLTWFWFTTPDGVDVTQHAAQTPTQVTTIAFAQKKKNRT
jgi:hypothetical protein